MKGWEAPMGKPFLESQLPFMEIPPPRGVGEEHGQTRSCPIHVTESP